MLLPGMSLEITGPPGSGKTSMAIAFALSARLGRWRGAEEEGYEEEAEDIGEVLIIGQLSVHRPDPELTCRHRGIDHA